MFLNISTYSSGYRGSSTTQSVKNIVQTLSTDFDFYIFISNHDFRLNKVYKTVEK